MRSLLNVPGSVVRDEGRATAAFDGPVRADASALARLEGFRAGREEGFAVGMAEGRARSLDSLSNAIDALQRIAAAVEQEQGRSQQQVAEMAMALAVELAESIVGGDLSLLENGADVVMRALNLRRTGETVRIHVAPGHAALTELAPRPGVEMVPDPELGPDDAFAEIGEGLADLSIAGALERVREALR